MAAAPLHSCHKFKTGFVTEEVFFWGSASSFVCFFGAANVVICGTALCAFTFPFSSFTHFVIRLFSTVRGFVLPATSV